MFNYREIKRESANEVIKFDDVKVEVFIFDDSFQVWSGKKTKKPECHYKATKTQREEWVEKYLKNKREVFAEKEEAKNFEAKDFFKVGDIVYDSWGYEQTNIDFYQIVGLTKKSVKIQKIAKNYIENGYLCGHSTPIKDKFLSDLVLTRRIRVYGKEAYINSDYGCISKYDGKELYESHYA